MRRVSVIGSSGSGKTTLAAHVARCLEAPHLELDSVFHQRGHSAVDLPRWVAMRRLIWRSLRRTVLRQELWNGNKEPWSSLFRADPEKSVIAWAWTQYHPNRTRYAVAVADPQHVHLTFVTLRSRREIAEFAGASALAGTRERPRKSPN